MSKDDFLRPRLIGERFEGKAVPLEVLKDLAVLEEMIVEAAKAEFLKDYPERQRTPRGFTNGVELRLTSIEDGSAVPVISLVVASPTLFPLVNHEYFEKARDSVISAIAAAQKGELITDHLPERLLGYFNRIGRSLREGEAMEFSTPVAQGLARLTRKVRRRLVYASAQEIAEETTVRGLVPEADQDDMRFELQLPDGKKVVAPIAPQHRDAILEAFNGYRAGHRILVHGVGIVNRGGKLVRIDSIEHINTLDPLDIGARIDEIRLLKDGWLEGEGKAPPAEGLDWLERACDLHYPDETVLPHLYPTPEGDMRAEWSDDRWNLSLDIHLADKRGAWHGLDLKTDDEKTRGLNLEDDEDWTWLIRTLKEKLGKVS